MKKLRYSVGLNTERHWKTEQMATIGIPNAFGIPAPTVLEIGLLLFNSISFWFQLSMGLMKLGVLSALLSDSLISGFTTGAAMHVFASQVPQLIGIKVTKFTGVGRLVKVTKTFSNTKYKFMLTLQLFYAPSCSTTFGFGWSFLLRSQKRITSLRVSLVLCML